MFFEVLCTSCSGHFVYSSPLHPCVQVSNLDVVLSGMLHFVSISDVVSLIVLMLGSSDVQKCVHSLKFHKIPGKTKAKKIIIFFFF